MKRSIYTVSKIRRNARLDLAGRNHVEDQNVKNKKTTTKGKNSSGNVFSYTEYNGAADEYNKNSNHDRNFTLRSKDLKKKNSKTKKTRSSANKHGGTKNSSQVVGKSIKSILQKYKSPKSFAQQLITPINWTSLSSFSVLRDESVLSSYAKVIYMPVGSVTASPSSTSLTQSCNNTTWKGSPQTVTFTSRYRKPSITDPAYLYQYYKKNWKNCHIPGESCIPICLETRNSLPFISN